MGSINLSITVASNYTAKANFLLTLFLHNQPWTSLTLYWIALRQFRCLKHSKMRRKSFCFSPLVDVLVVIRMVWMIYDEQWHLGLWQIEDLTRVRGEFKMWMNSHLPPAHSHSSRPLLYCTRQAEVVLFCQSALVKSFSLYTVYWQKLVFACFIMCLISDTKYRAFKKMINIKIIIIIY